MKDITGEVTIEQYEIGTLKSDPIRYAYKVLVNVYSNSIDTRITSYNVCYTKLLRSCRT